MKTLWNDEHRVEILERMGRITPATAPAWGKMNAPRMVAHVGDWFRMALGELPIPERRIVVRHFPLKQLLLYVLPLPKNLPTAPELQRDACSLDDELASFKASLKRFTQSDAHAAWLPHPVFGPLAGSAWGALGYKHTDHHLRQFRL